MRSLPRLRSTAAPRAAPKRFEKSPLVPPRNLLRDPLLAPLAAIATGILLSRLVPFETRELLALLAAYLILTLISVWRRSLALAGVCCLVAFVITGTLTA